MTNRKLIDYILLGDTSVLKLKESILKAASQGYELNGGVIDDGKQWIQTMVKYEDIHPTSSLGEAIGIINDFRLKMTLL